MLNIKYLDKVIVNRFDYYAVPIIAKPFRTYEFFEKEFKNLEDAIRFIARHKNLY